MGVETEEVMEVVMQKNYASLLCNVQGRTGLDLALGLDLTLVGMEEEEEEGGEEPTS